MFGYVKPYVPELKVAEYEKYRAVYCGLCRAMGKVTGQASRMTLSYDLVFLASVRMILRGTIPEFEKMRCAAHVAKQRLVVKPNDDLEFTAAVAAILAGAKVDDDLADERAMSRVKPMLEHPLTRHMEKRARRALDTDAGGEIRKLLARLTVLENEKCASADETADAFGAVLEYAFSAGLDGEARENAKMFGRCVGRFVYICDAADDLAEDMKKGRYNPLALGWGDLALTEGKLSPVLCESLMISTPIMLEEIGEAAEKLDKAHVLTPIVKNIVYLGLPAAMRKIVQNEE